MFPGAVLGRGSAGEGPNAKVMTLFNDFALLATPYRLFCLLRLCPSTQWLLQTPRWAALVCSVGWVRVTGAAAPRGGQSPPWPR